MVKRSVFLVVLFWGSIAFAQYEHEFYTGQQFGVQWDESTLALGYCWHIDRISDGFVIAQGITASLEMSANIQSAGIYVFYCRAWNYDIDGTTIQYSDWASSLMHGLVNGVIRAWQIKVNLRPVGPLLIFDERYAYP